MGKYAFAKSEGFNTSRMEKQLDEVLGDDNRYFTIENLAKKGVVFGDLSEAEQKQALFENYLENKAADTFDQRHPELGN